MSNGTTFENKCEILSDLWLTYRYDEKFQDFVSYNDVGLPLSFVSAEGLAKPSEMGKQLIGETFDLLLAAMNITEDPGFDDLDEILVGE
mgnify:CR=1 FL=1